MRGWEVAHTPGWAFPTMQKPLASDVQQRWTCQALRAHGHIKNKYFEMGFTDLDSLPQVTGCGEALVHSAWFVWGLNSVLPTLIITGSLMRKHTPRTASKRLGGGGDGRV